MLAQLCFDFVSPSSGLSLGFCQAKFLTVNENDVVKSAHVMHTPKRSRAYQDIKRTAT